MTAYVVLAAQLHQRVSEEDAKKRRVVKHRRGDVVTDLSDADVERHLKGRAIAAKSSAEAKEATENQAPPEPVVEPYVAPEDQASPIVAETQSTGGVPRPKQAASKAEWEAYAQARGIDTEGMTREQLREATK